MRLGRSGTCSYMLDGLKTDIIVTAWLLLLSICYVGPVRLSANVHEQLLVITFLAQFYGADSFIRYFRFSAPTVP